MPFIIKRKNSNMLLDSLTGDNVMLTSPVSVRYISVLNWAVLFQTEQQAQNIIKILEERLKHRPLEIKEVTEVSGIRKYVEKT